MRHETVTTAKRLGVDWKALGYLISIISVLFLGAVAASKDDPPAWYFPMLVAGMLTSIVGMACRYKAHLDEKREIARAERKNS